MSENTTNINNRLTVGRATVEPATMSNGNVLFSLQPYIEKEHIPDHAFLVYQNQPTIETLDDINAPYAKVLKFTGYNNECTLGEKIAVSAGERIYVEAWYMVPAADTGTAGLNYLGVRRYDKDNKPIAVNDGRNYVVSGLTLTVDGNWYKMSGYYTVESSHTPYNGSDGGAVRYLDLTFRLNFSTGTQEIYISGLTIKKVNASYDEGDTAFKGDVGIGTDNPDSKLHIVGSGNTSGTNALLVENSDGTEIFKVNDVGNTFVDGFLYPSNYIINNGGGDLQIANSGVVKFGVDGGGGVNSLTIKNTGQLIFNKYTSTTFDGTPNKFLGVDASGNVIKSSSVLTSTPTLQEVTDAGNSTTNSITIGVTDLYTPSAKLSVESAFAGFPLEVWRRSDFGEVIKFGRSSTYNSNNHYGYLGIDENGEVIIGNNGNEVIRIDSSQNIGIGTSSPSAKTHIVGGAAAGGGTALLVENTEGTDLVKVLDSGTTVIDSSNTTLPLEVKGSGALLQSWVAAGSNSFVNFHNSSTSGTGHTTGLTIALASNDAYFKNRQAGRTILSTNNVDRLELASDGQLKLNNYTSTNFDGTPTAILGVDSSGNVIKQASTDFLTDVPTLQQVTDVGATTDKGITAASFIINSDGALFDHFHSGTSNTAVEHRFRSNVTGLTNAANILGYVGFAKDTDGGSYFNVKYTDDLGAVNTLLRGNSSGGVSIGTTGNSAKLHIVGGAAAGGGTALLVENGAGDDLLKVEDNSDTTVFGEFKLAGYTSTFYDDTPNKFLGVDSSGNVVKQSRTWHSGIATTTTDANGEFILGSIPSSANAVTCCQYDSAGTATVYIFVYRGKNGSNQHFFKVYDLSGNAVTSTSIGVSFTYTMYPV